MHGLPVLTKYDSSPVVPRLRLFAQFLLQFIVPSHCARRRMRCSVQDRFNLHERWIRTMQPHASFVVALLGCTLFAQAEAPAPVQTPQQLVADVIYNEIQDRGSDSFWEYRSVRVSGMQNVVREQ